MASFNGDAVSEKFNKTGPESPRALNRQIKSIVGGGPEQLIKNQKDSAQRSQQQSFFAFLSKKTTKNSMRLVQGHTSKQRVGSSDLSQ